MSLFALVVLVPIAVLAALLSVNAVLSYVGPYRRDLSDIRALFAAFAWIALLVAANVLRGIGVA